jgi:hypothetical protein
LENGPGFNLGRLDVGFEAGLKIGLRNCFGRRHELDLAAVEDTQFAGFDEIADFAGEGGAVLLVQIQQAPEHEIVGGAVVWLAEFGKEAVAEGHVKSGWR